MTTPDLTLIQGTPTKVGALTLVKTVMECTNLNENIYYRAEEYLEERHEEMGFLFMELSLVDTTAVRLQNDLVGYLRQYLAFLEAAKTGEYRKQEFQKWLWHMVEKPSRLMTEVPFEIFEQVTEAMITVCNEAEQVTVHLMTEVDARVKAAEKVTVADNKPLVDSLLTGKQSMKAQHGCLVAMKEMLEFAKSAAHCIEELS